MTEHLDLDALADLLVGQSAPGGVDQAHLSTCPDCAARLAELEEAQVPVTASLGSLPAPALPDDLASRITAALAAQPPLRPAPDGDAQARNPAAVDARSEPDSQPAGATVTPLAPRRPAPRRWLPAAAAAVVLLGGASLGYTLLSDSRSERDALTAAPGGSAERGTGLVRRDSALDYADPAAVAAALPAVLAGSPGEVARREAAAPPPGAPVPAPGRDSAGAPLAARPGEAAGQPAPDPLGRLREPGGLASCLLALLPPDQPEVRPLALDYARYQGMPALAVVLPDADPAKVSVFVVGPRCSQSDDDTRFFTRLARP